MPLSENIRLMRESRGLSQSELAEKIGLQKQNVSAYERGIKVPSVAEHSKLDSTIDYISNTSDFDTISRIASDVAKMVKSVKENTDISFCAKI